MRRFLIASQSRGQLQMLQNLQTLVQERRPDGVLYSGSILANDHSTPAEKAKKWEEFFDGVGKLGVFVALVPGATEAPLRNFLRLAKDAEIEYPDVHVAHATLFEQTHIAVSGLGGDLTEAEDCSDNFLYYSRPTAEYFLRTLWLSEQPRTILLLGVPPPGQLGGETGNRICGDFIDSYHPSLCVVAGATERRGCQRIAQDLVINPGRLADGSAAWLDWDRNKDEQVEFLQL